MSIIPMAVTFDVELLEEDKYDDYEEIYKYRFTPVFIHHNASNFNMIPCKLGKGVAFGMRYDDWEENVISFNTGILIKTKEGAIEEVDFDDNWTRTIVLGKSFEITDLR